MEQIEVPAQMGARHWLGLVPGAAPAVLAAAARQGGARPLIAFLPHTRQAEAWTEDLAFHWAALGGPAPEIRLLPEEPDEELTEARANDLLCDRIAALAALRARAAGGPAGAPPLVLLTTPAAFWQPVPPAAQAARRELILRRGGTFPFAELTARLGRELGYANEAVCETPGQFAVRGGLVDVYPLNADAPVRVDFFGDEIEDLREFDPTTQRGGQRLDEVRVAPAFQADAKASPREILGYLPAAATFAFVEPDAQAEAHPTLFQAFERMATPHPTMADLLRARAGRPDAWLALSELEGRGRFFAAAEKLTLESSNLAAWRGGSAAEAGFGLERAHAEQASRHRFLEKLDGWARHGWSVRFVTRNEGEAEQVRALAREHAPALLPRAEWALGPLHEGFVLPAHPALPPPLDAGKGTVWVAGTEVFGAARARPVGVRRRKLPQKHQLDQLLDFSDLHEGDYMVHLGHGICRYRGLTRIELRGRQEDVISLEFENNLTLHLPLHEAHLVTRYVGLTKTKPKLGRVGSGSFEKAKRAAEKAVLDYAAQLLAVQAKRETAAGHAHAADSPAQAEFEAAFPYRETADQLRSIGEVKADLEKPRPMDRLLCGDVGFGKTEVALRAAFKVVQEGRQVALLVPTTVLAQQHFNNFRERLAPYPITVEMLSGFRRKDQQDRIVAQLQGGGVDIVIGTHRLISKDVAFRDLGLVVIDEEHRFGVRHKERLKHLRETVDVLTMSATPIPRTLYLALMGARDLSTLDTPPADRLPIQTVVKPYSPELVRQAIALEVERGGQVFYLHNRVQTIEETALGLQRLFPKLRIGIGHGQMDDGALEKVMTKFVAGEYDVLVCTTIIESGIDIANCNTLIIEGADRFGLAQLYQLRGRVGRSRRQAYAYLLLHRHGQLLDQARKRLTTLRQYTQPGAGFRIAMRDLELRGAGNLLGAEQSGHIAGLGFDLYCQLLRQSIAALKGEPSARRVRASVRLDFLTLGEGETLRTDAPRLGYDTLKEVDLEGGRIPPVTAFLPADYLAETRLRLDFYRRLALADTPGAVAALREELADRFGQPPEPALALLALHEIRTLAEAAGVAAVTAEGTLLKCQRAGGKADEFLKLGARFPRLEGRTPARRLEEIRAFLCRHLPEPAPAVAPPPGKRAVPPAPPAPALGAPAGVEVGGSRANVGGPLGERALPPRGVPPALSAPTAPKPRGRPRKTALFADDEDPADAPSKPRPPQTSASSPAEPSPAPPKRRGRPPKKALFADDED